MTAGPSSPGVGLYEYQPACSGCVTGGTCTVLSALSPSGTSVEWAWILGMSTETGSDLGIAATTGPSAGGVTTCCSRAGGGPAGCGAGAPQPTSDSVSDAAARSR